MPGFPGKGRKTEMRTWFRTLSAGLLTSSRTVFTTLKFVWVEPCFVMNCLYAPTIYGFILFIFELWKRIPSNIYSVSWDLLPAVELCSWRPCSCAWLMLSHLEQTTRYPPTDGLLHGLRVLAGTDLLAQMRWGTCVGVSHRYTLKSRVAESYVCGSPTWRHNGQFTSKPGLWFAPPRTVSEALSIHSLPHCWHSQVPYFFGRSNMGILVSNLGLNLHFISDKLQFSDTNEMSNIQFNLILMLLTQAWHSPPVRGSALQHCPHFWHQLQMGCPGHPYFCLANYNCGGSH